MCREDVETARDTYTYVIKNNYQGNHLNGQLPDQYKSKSRKEKYEEVETLSSVAF